MENELFQIVETRYVKGEIKVYGVYEHKKCHNECTNIMHKMYKREGFFVKHRSDSVEFYTDTSSHWKIKLEIVGSIVDDVNMLEEINNCTKLSNITHRAHMYNVKNSFRRKPCTKAAASAAAENVYEMTESEHTDEESDSDISNDPVLTVCD